MVSRIGARYSELVDPLSDVLELVTVSAAVTSRLEAAGDWGLRFAGGQHAKFGVVHRGVCWLAAGDLAPVRLGAGDCYLVTTGGPYTMTSAPGTPTQDGDARWRADATAAVLRVGLAPTDGQDTPETIVTGGRFEFDRQRSDLLVDLLPPILHVRATAEQATALRALMDLLALETSTERPGAALTRDHLARLALVHALRTHADQHGPAPGWLRGVADPRIGPALRALHENPLRAWTVTDLAHRAHLARSTFAARFREVVGSPPLDYLLRWRMHHAVTLLRQGHTVGEVANMLGYASHSSFSHAFTRTTGVPPSRYAHAPFPRPARSSPPSW